MATKPPARAVKPVATVPAHSSPSPSQVRFKAMTGIFDPTPASKRRRTAPTTVPFGTPLSVGSLEDTDILPMARPMSPSRATLEYPSLATPEYPSLATSPEPYTSAQSTMTVERHSSPAPIPAPPRHSSPAPIPAPPRRASSAWISAPTRRASPTSVLATAELAIPGEFSHMSAEEYQTHVTRVSMAKSLKQGKASANNYDRHVAAYERYWLQYQHMRLQDDPQCVLEPAHPITATKAAIFLKYESERPKRTADHEGGTVGIESIKQCISALESYRFNHQHERIYAQREDALRPLRSDARIKQFEISKKASEPQRIMSGEKSKATGTSSDTYTVAELKQSSMWCLKSRKSATSLLLGARDRCMLLLSTVTAFRGDSTRSLLFSDLSMRDVPMPELSDYTSGTTAALEALILLRDQGKHNQEGRVEEHAAFRHRDAELCCIGAVALYLFVLFHIIGREVPDFSPDFSDPTSGNFGRRLWYTLYMFPGKDGDDSSMSYKQHLNRVNLIQARNNIIISSKTHAGRKFTVKNIRDNRASRSEAKAVGRWSENGNGAYDRYDRSLPIEGMLAAASFNGRSPESYMIPRNCLEPPLELVKTLFPWAEEEQEKMRQRREAHGAQADDYSLKGFLDFIIRSRRILLQDAAVLMVKHPECEFFKYAPFDNPIFHEFALHSTQAILDVEARFRENMKNLPMHVAATFRGVVNTVGMEQQHMMQQIDARFGAVEALLGQFIQADIAHSRKRKRAQPVAAILPIPSSAHSTFALPSLPPLPPPPPPPPPPPSYPRTSNDAPTALSIFNPGVISHHTPSTHPADVERSLREAAMTELQLKYGEERVQRHQWEWIESTSSMPSRFLPHYLYTRRKSSGPGGKDEPLSVDDIWQEHVVGLNGHLSVTQLNDGWGGSWKRNVASEKSEGSRRAKLVALIQELQKRPNWTSALALKFLHDRYPIDRLSPFPHLRSTRSFMEWLQRAKGSYNFQSVLDSATTYHG